MNCEFCGSASLSSEHLPTDENGTYVFKCETVLQDGEWYRSGRCRNKSKGATMAPPWHERGLQLEAIQGPYCFYAAWEEWMTKNESVIEIMGELNDLDKSYLFVLFEKACEQTASDEAKPRCTVCSWPLAEDAKDGCTEGNCCMRQR